MEAPMSQEPWVPLPLKMLASQVEVYQMVLEQVCGNAACPGLGVCTVGLSCAGPPDVSSAAEMNCPVFCNRWLWVCLLLWHLSARRCSDILSGYPPARLRSIKGCRWGRPQVHLALQAGSLLLWFFMQSQQSNCG